ncbi:hypothetical protein [Bradyrhizobium sp.]|uniref:hypothetical protein n=1 Tax=Bradyrhizobium sp. TaxID=376 RepID=UPI003C55BADF
MGNIVQLFSQEAKHTPPESQSDAAIAVGMLIASMQVCHASATLGERLDAVDAAIDTFGDAELLPDLKQLTASARQNLIASILALKTSVAVFAAYL